MSELLRRTALVVMARYPAAGEVKTRLARALGSDRACDLYRAFLRDIAQRFTAAARELVWAFHPPDRDFASIVGGDARCLAQQGHDLGARMLHCFRTLHADGYERIIMIGADVPHVRSEWIDEAEHALDAADVVLGPSEDGGYYLVAMHAAHDIFSGIAMGTARVLAETLQTCAAAGLRVHLLPPTFDVDDESDLVQLRALLARPDVPPLLHTAAVLAQWEREGLLQ